MSHHNTRDDKGRERFTFPSHIRRDGSAVYPPLPGDEVARPTTGRLTTDEPQPQRLPPASPEVVALLKTWITPAVPQWFGRIERPAPRLCIACRALVPWNKPEACPHE